MRYIIKNCPAICINHNNEYDCDKAEYSCQDCTDCAMKRIVELCKQVERENIIDTPKTAREVIWHYGKLELADGILKLLEIEECE